MKKMYIVISHYCWDGEWGIGNAIPCKTYAEARQKLLYIASQEEDQITSDQEDVKIFHLVNGTTNEGFEKVIKDNPDNLYLIEDFGESIIISKHRQSAEYHFEVTMQEINI